MKTRCAWGDSHPLYQAYHDLEWGVPVHDDRRLFEFLTLEGAQAGLSWLTILKKRDRYREAFNHFDFRCIAAYTRNDIERLMSDEGIIRNRRKIESTIQNAQCTLKIIAQHGSLDAFLWRYVDGKPIQNTWTDLNQIPARTPLSDTISHDLKKLGFNFVGPTIMYAFMQAVGMVNDHTTDCFRHGEIRNRA